MTRIVVDANLAVALVVPLAYSESTQRSFAEWTESGRELYAPALWSYEVTSALRKAETTGRIDAAAADEGLAAILDLGVVEVAARRELHERALSWARRLGSTAAYDAAYLALAQELEAELWTADRRLARAASIEGAECVFEIEAP